MLQTLRMGDSAAYKVIWIHFCTSILVRGPGFGVKECSLLCKLSVVKRGEQGDPRANNHLFFLSDFSQLQQLGALQTEACGQSLMYVNIGQQKTGPGAKQGVNQADSISTPISSLLHWHTVLQQWDEKDPKVPSDATHHVYFFCRRYACLVQSGNCAQQRLGTFNLFPASVFNQRENRRDRR